MDEFTIQAIREEMEDMGMDEESIDAALEAMVEGEDGLEWEVHW